MTNQANQGFEKSLWHETAEAALDCPTLQGIVETGTVVIGGGFTGLSTALHLSQSGNDVCVLEAKQPGWGGAGRNGGQVNPGWKMLPDEVLTRYGAERGKRILKIMDQACDLVFNLIDKHHIDCAPRRSPYFRAAAKSRGLKEAQAWVEQWQQFGAAVSLANRSQTEEILGSGFFDGGFTDERGGSLQPLSYTRGLARAAIVAGATIYANSPATQIERVGNQWQVTTPKGKILARHLVIGTNGYTTNLWPGLEKQVVPVASLVTATAPLPDEIREGILPGGHHVSDTRRSMVYFKVDEDGRFIIGGRGRSLTATRQYDDTTHLQREAIRIYPQLGHIKWEYQWGGLVAMTKSHTPHLIELAPNAFAGLGYNGRGVAMGTMMGKLLAKVIQGEDVALPREKLTPFAFHAFRGLGIAWFMLTSKWLDYLDRN